MFSEILKKRYEVLLRQRSNQIAELKKLVLKQEEELAEKEVLIISLQEEIKNLSVVPASKKTTRQRKRKTNVEQPEGSTNDKPNSN